jgi:dTMP kinase
MTRGYLITFEGGEGCGKSTQVQRLAQRLAAQGRQTLLFREPGGTPLGERIRELLRYHDPHEPPMCPLAELLLFAASRAQLVAHVIAPALQQGQVVIGDRFTDSTTVYQGLVRGVDRATLEALQHKVTQGLSPDLTFWLDVPAPVGLDRVARRTAQSADRLEQEPLAFHEAVRRGYATLAQQEPGRFHRIEAQQSPEAIEQEVWHVVSRLLG